MAKKPKTKLKLKRKPLLSDTEVALIKAMLATGQYSRQEILTYFSRTDRPVNLGRISEIAQEKKRSEVKKSTPGELDKFLKQAGSAAFVPANDPIGDAALAQLFALKYKRPTAQNVEESETVEFKVSFNWASRSKYAKTLAGFANHKGGYILFGINDEGKVVGMKNEAFLKRDASDVSAFLNSCFQPQIYWKRTVWKVGAKSVGVLWASTCERKPMICYKNSDPLKESAIYYRYIGETRSIAYSELVSVLEDRDRQTEQALATTVGRIAEIGSDRAGILDTTTGKIEGRGGSIIIDESILDKVRFITEGRFDEIDGDPTLRVVGEVQTVPRVASRIVINRKTVLTSLDVLNDFLDQKNVDSPRSYIRQIVHDQAYIIPVFYYVAQAGLSISDAVKLIQDEPGAPESQKLHLIGRLTGRKAHPAALGPSTKPYQLKILAGKSVRFDKAKNRLHAIKAIQTIPIAEIDLATCVMVLKAAMREFTRNPNNQFLGEIRYGAAHVDAAVFAKDIPD